MTDRDEILSRLDRITDVEHELSNILQTLVLNDSTIIDALAQMLGAIQKMNVRAERAQEKAETAQNRLAEEIRALSQMVADLSGQPARPKPSVALNNQVLSDGDDR